MNKRTTIVIHIDELQNGLFQGTLIAGLEGMPDELLFRSYAQHTKQAAFDCTVKELSNHSSYIMTM